MRQAILLSAAALLFGSINLASAGSTGFSSMSVGADQPAACEAPRPPVDLNPSAYIRNGYRATLRIMAAERWQETGSCACFLSQITWEEVVAESQNYVISDNPALPFDVIAMNKIADDLEAARIKACGF